jgi:hypothetical protein
MLAGCAGWNRKISGGRLEAPSVRQTESCEVCSTLTSDLLGLSLKA